MSTDHVVRSVTVLRTGAAHVEIGDAVGRSPAEHQPLTAAQKFSVLGLGRRFPVPKVFLGLPMGTGVTYSPVAERVSRTVDTKGREKKVATSGSDSCTRNCWFDAGGG